MANTIGDYYFSEGSGGSGGTGSTTTTCGAAGAWGTWITDTTAVTNCVIWGNWTQGTASAASSNYVAIPQPTEPTPQETEAQRLAHIQESKRAQEANDRAEALLLRFLDKEQQAEFKKDGRIHVCVKSGRRYRLQHGSVQVVDKAGNRLESMCCHVPYTYQLPPPDQVLAQMFWLRHHEEEFRRTANFH